MTEPSGKGALDIEQIRQLLPHRYPFLLVDRILEVEPGVRAVGLKNVSANEPFFNGHFQELRVMPGVLILEALAQVSGIAAQEFAEGGKKLGLFAAVNKARFRRPVVPGDQLRLEADIIRMKLGVAKIATRATVDGEIAADAELILSFR